MFSLIGFLQVNSLLNFLSILYQTVFVRVSLFTVGPRPCLDHPPLLFFEHMDPPIRFPVRAVVPIIHFSRHRLYRTLVTNTRIDSVTVVDTQRCLPLFAF